MPTTWDGQPLDPPNLSKPVRGSAILEREDAAAKALAIERHEKAKAKKRDGRCRWPEPHKCRGGALEAAHLRDASLLGAMAADNLVTFCPWIHRRGPESIHGKQLKVMAETAAGAYGPLSFWRQDPDGIYHMVRREVAPFQYERD